MSWYSWFTVYQLSSCFENCSNLIVADLNNWKINNTQSLYCFFSNCSNLHYLGMSNWQTNNVENLAQMFFGCNSIEKIYMSGWCLPKINHFDYSFSGIFLGCDTLEYLNLDNLSIPNAIDSASFGNSTVLPSSLQTISMVNLYAPSLTSISGSFSGKDFVKKMDLTGWNISSVQNATGFLSGCSGLQELSVRNWKTESIRYFNSFFSGCKNLTNLDLESWAMDSAVNLQNMFNNCIELSELKIRGWNFKKLNTIDNLKGLFNSCTSLKSLDLSYWEFHNLYTLVSFTTNLGINSCSALTSLKMDYCNINYVTGVMNAFANCNHLKSLSIKKWKTPNVTQMTAMFSGSTNLTEVEMSSWYLPNVQQIMGFLSGQRIVSLNLNKLSMPNLTDASGFFSGSSYLKNLNITGMNLPKVVNLSSAFNGCSSLEFLDLSSFDTKNVTNFSQMFVNCSQLKYINTNYLNVDKGTDFSVMFANCTNLKYLDFSTWNTSAAKNMDYFAVNSGITKITLGKSFKFIGDTNYLPEEVWKKISDGSSYNLWTKYNGATMADTYITDNSEIELNTDNVNEILYSKDTSELTVYTRSKEGQTPTPITFLDLSSQKIKFAADLIKTNSDLDTLLSKNFNNNNILLTLKNRTYVDIVGCSKQEKVLWTFNIPQNNKSIIRLDLLKNKTENIGYIQNSKENLDIFTLYDKKGNVIEVLKPNKRHTYKELGYIGSYNTTEIDKDGKEKLIHHDSTHYGGDIGDMTDDKLENEVYPEYTSYLSYNSIMNNYEVPMAPGHYEIDSTLNEYTNVNLTPSKLITKIIDKLDDKGEPILDKDGNKITQEIPVAYIYDNKTDFSKIETSFNYFTLFNQIYERSYNVFSDEIISQEIFQKINTSGKGVSGATYSFTSRLTGATYTATTNGDGTITSSNLNGPVQIGESFDVHEVKAPEGYLLNPESATITFRKYVSQKKELGTDYVIYNDGVSIPSESKSKCYTCEVYFQCTCNKFGTSNCHCCGVPSWKDDHQASFVTLTDYFNRTNLWIYKKVDSSVSDYHKKNTVFSFKLYDVTDNKLCSSFSLRADASTALTPAYFQAGHTYKIIEDSFLPSGYTPVSNEVVSSTSDDSSSFEWVSTVQVDNNDYLGYSAVSGNAYIFTYENDMTLTQLPSITFINHRNNFKHNLTISKKVESVVHESADKEKNFNFCLNLKNITLNLNNYQIKYVKSDGSSGNITLDQLGNFKFTLKHEQTIEFMNIPDITDYKITEDKYYNYHVKSTNNEGRILGENVVSSFKNIEINPGSLKLIKKDGEKLLSGVTFSLTQEDGTKVGTGTTDKNGEILFENLEEGTYTVKEEQTTKGHTLLSKPFTVTIPFAIKKDKAEAAKMDTTPATLIGDTYYYYDLVYTVENSATPNLPTTGNKENTKFYILLILAIVSIVIVEYYLSSTKKKKKAK